MQYLRSLRARGSRWQSWALLILLTYACITGQAYGITQSGLYQSGINYFDLSVGCGAGSDTLVGSDNIQMAFNFLVNSKGLSAIAAAGIVGNLMAESHVDPLEADTSHGVIESPTIPAEIIGKGGYGIAQWTSSGRQNALIAFAKSQGKQEGDLLIQLEYLWQEATTTYKGVLENVKAATTPSDAATQWMGPNISGPNRSGGFENPRADVAHEDVRRKNAEDVYAKYAGSTASAAAQGSGDTTATVCSSTNFISGFIEYKQCNYHGVKVPWANAPYGDETVCDGGCGPSAMAMIITNLTGQHITPDVTAKYGYEHGTRQDSGGSLWNIADVVGSHWGLQSKELGKSADKINQVLQSGGLVLASGTGPNPFTDAGHFIVIRALTSDGKWLTGNSAGYDSSKPYDPSTIMASLRNSWGLTKTQAL